MITSPHNEKLKLVRKLGERKHRDRHGLFVAEGEDLVAAAEAAGLEPEWVLIAGRDVEPSLLDAVSALGSGTRALGVYRQRWAEPQGPVCVYLHGVADPGNVGAVIRTAHALIEGTVVLGPGCADPYSPKAVRATMGSIFAQPVAGAHLDATPPPRIALRAHGGRPLDEIGPATDPAAAESGDEYAAGMTLCLGAERAGLPADALALCDEEMTIPLRAGGAESLNVAAAAAIALHHFQTPSSRANLSGMGISSARRRG
jgi:TrmH family RNA methyltransferase